MSLLSLAQFKRGKELEELLSSGGGSAASKVKTAVPCQAEKITYTGEELSPVWDNFDESTVFIEGKSKAVDIGEYTVTFYPKTGYMWPDKTDGAKNVKWQIDKAPVDEPVIADAPVPYNSALQMPFENFEQGGFVVEGTLWAEEIGNYTVSLTPDNNHCWQDGSSSTKTYIWSIGQGVAEYPIKNEGRVFYDGEMQTPFEYNKDAIKAEGTFKESTPGTYEAVFTPNEKYAWPDGTTEPLTYTWTLTDVVIPEPSFSKKANLVYNGSNYIIANYLDNYDPKKITYVAGGVNSSANAGSYMVQMKPASGYCWADGTKTVKMIPWSIKKAPCSIIPSEDEVVLNVLLSQSTKIGIPPEKSAVSILPANAEIFSVSSTVTAGVSATLNFAAYKHFDKEIRICCDATTNYEAADVKIRVRTEPRTIIVKTGNTLSNFYGGNFTKLTELPDIYDVSQCVHLNNFFVKSNLIQIDMSTWDVSSVRNFDNVFNSCQKLESVILPTTFPKEADTSLALTFDGCTSLKEIYLPEMKIASLGATFRGCKSLESIDFTSIINKDSLVISQSGSNLGNYGKSITPDGLFYECYALKSVPLANYSFANNSAAWTFADCKSLKSIPFENFNTENVAFFTNFCSGCTSLESVNLDSLNTEKGIDFRCIFANCTNLKNATGTLDLTSVPATFSYTNSSGKSVTGNWWNLLGSAFVGTQVKSLKVKVPAHMKTVGVNDMKTYLGLSSDAEIIFV